MEEFLKQLIGKKVDIAFGSTAIVRGDVVDIKESVLFLQDEHDRVAYVSINKIAVVWEVREHQSRPGFVV